MFYKRPLVLNRFTQRKNSEGRFSKVMIKKLGKNKKYRGLFLLFHKNRFSLLSFLLSAGCL